MCDLALACSSTAMFVCVLETSLCHDFLRMHVRILACTCMCMLYSQQKVTVRVLNTRYSNVPSKLHVHVRVLTYNVHVYSVQYVQCTALLTQEFK